MLQAPVTGNERALIGALFFACGLLSLLPATTFADQNENVDDSCVTAAIELADTREVRVKKVVDGDTIITQEGERVRLIGIDAPELKVAFSGHPEQLAQAAKEQLERLFAGDNRAYLSAGKQPRDRYGRTLATVLTGNNINPAGLLLLKGLAQTLAIPPNLRHAECYQRAETRAQMLEVGLWSPDYWQIHKAIDEELKQGFYFLEGEVTRVGRSRKNHWMILDQRIWVAVTWYDLPNFPKHLWPEQLENAKVRVKGRLFYSHGQWRLKLRHASALTVLEREPSLSQ